MALPGSLLHSVACASPIAGAVSAISPRWQSGLRLSQSAASPGLPRRTVTDASAPWLTGIAALGVGGAGDGCTAVPGLSGRWEVTPDAPPSVADKAEI